jgi:hypothetical protein
MMVRKLPSLAENLREFRPVPAEMADLRFRNASGTVVFPFTKFLKLLYKPGTGTDLCRF